MSAQTRWSAVVILIAAGMVAAFQIGKAAIAVPLLQQDLGLSLVFASWIVGAFGALGAFGGIFAGTIVSMFEPRRTLLVGLCLTGLASIAGALAPNGAVLLATRVAEGCGFLAIVLSVPRLLRTIAGPAERDRIFAFWGVYLPAGSALMMLLGPLIAAPGWRVLWLVNGVAALAYAGVIARTIAAQPGAAEASRALLNIAQVLRSPGPLLLTAIFGIYTFHYFALTGLLPTLLVDRLGLSIAAAGVVSALTVLANGIGNLTAGVLIRMGVPLWAVATAGFTVIGTSGFAIFSDQLPVTVIALAAAATLAVSGLIPASIFAAAPRLAASAALLSITIGLAMNGSNLGQLLGPAALAAFVQRYGWDRAPLLFVGVMVAGLSVALALRAVLRRAGPPAGGA
ncbi:MAG: MFS transporter [Alphaproteobacteria bacterium]|nr:MAG: MFS transporter [Alphaproteobacteria bacterium]